MTELFAKRILRGLTVFVVLVVASSAWADDKISIFAKTESSDAAKKATEARRLFEVGKVDEAIEAYKAAYVLEAAPKFLINIAVAYNREGRHEEALEWIRRLKDRFRNLDAQSRERVERLLVDIKENIENQKSISAAREDREKEPALSATHTSAKPARQPEAAQSTQAANSERWYADPLGWTLAGTGLVAASVGGFLLVDSSSLRRDAEAADDQTERRRLEDRADSRLKIGVVALAVGGAFLVAGVVKLAITPSEEKATIAVAPTRDGVVALVSGSW